MVRWHCPPDTGFEIRALAVWGRARYLWVTEAPHNTEFHTGMVKKHICCFQTAETGNRIPNSSVKGSGANHYPRAPAPITKYVFLYGMVTSAKINNVMTNVGVCLFKPVNTRYICHCELSYKVIPKRIYDKFTYKGCCLNPHVKVLIRCKFCHYKINLLF